MTTRVTTTDGGDGNSRRRVILPLMSSSSSTWIIIRTARWGCGWWLSFFSILPLLLLLAIVLLLVKLLLLLLLILGWEFGLDIYLLNSYQLPIITSTAAKRCHNSLCGRRNVVGSCATTIATVFWAGCPKWRLAVVDRGRCSRRENYLRLMIREMVTRLSCEGCVSSTGRSTKTTSPETIIFAVVSSKTGIACYGSCSRFWCIVRVTRGRHGAGRAAAAAVE